jgi:hypothetical protein
MLLPPQLVPAGLLLLKLQTGEPLLQAMVPYWHWLVGWQLWPTVQAMQLPLLLQTWLVPQLVPAVLLVVALQTGVPVLQEIEPFWQGLVGWQLWPEVHEMQLALLLQTMLVPQLVPAVLLVVALQTGAPVAQEIEPFWQGFVGWHEVPVVQAPQLPRPSHT